ncbi:MAG: hypothetical protein QOJ70_3028 [Acidobacteriota bacterium]|nr:hypothetical protein [Acidobacteriota bacterium]
MLLIPLFGGLALIKLFPTRVELKPVAGRFEPVERSAFRTLGLAATATQGEVFDAASRVRLALKLGVRKTFDADAAWLGTIERGESEVRDSIGRLSEPAQRARERLFWFHGRAPMRRAPNVAELMRAVDALLSGEPVESGNGSGAQETDAALHDAALLALAGLVRLDPALRDLDAWARTFDLWQRVFECEEFWSRLVAADLKGDYEQSVTFGKVAELRMSAPRIVSAHVASRARDAAMREDLRACLRAFRLLRGASTFAATGVRARGGWPHRRRAHV